METTPVNTKAVRPLLQSVLVIGAYLISASMIFISLSMFYEAFVSRNEIGSEAGNIIFYGMGYLLFGVPIFGIGRFIDKLNFAGKSQKTTPAVQTELANQTPLQIGQHSQRAKMSGLIIFAISVVMAGYGFFVLYSGYNYLNTNPLATSQFLDAAARQEFLSGVQNGMYMNGIIILILSAAMIDFGYKLYGGKFRFPQTEVVQPTAANPVKASIGNILLRIFLLLNTFLLLYLSLSSLGSELSHLFTGQYVNYFSMKISAVPFVLSGGTYYLYTLLKKHPSV